MKSPLRTLCWILLGATLSASPKSLLASTVTFTNLSENQVTGVDFSRTRSARDSEYLQFFDPVSGQPRTDIPFVDTALAPSKSRGASGVCLFDYDGDGDEDIYATNGPGTANSLYSNQWMETGTLSFVDVASQAKVGAEAVDSSGCSAGDIDNDGDRDLYVLSTGDDNVLFENLGDGTFKDLSATSATGGNGRWATSSSMCDVNADGLLDIVVGNTFDMKTSLAIFVEPTALNEHNQLFVNQGNNVFVDESQVAGLEDLAGMRILNEHGEIVPIPGSPAGISWSVACVDYDLDGDVDIFTGDDQAAISAIGDPQSPFGAPNADRGLIHIFMNDGTGRFSDVNDRISTNRLPGSWMGLSFGDYNHDGHLDFFNSNFGDANLSLAFETPLLGVQPSRWFLSDQQGGFTDSLDLGGGVVPGLLSTPFGWGTSSVDYDNDGDTDILFVGDIQAGPFVTSSNPVAIWDNDGLGNFTANLDSLTPEDADLHKRSAEHGMATGDLDRDGFLDFVTVSNFVVPEDLRKPQPPSNEPLLLPNPFNFGGPYDAAGEFLPTFGPTLDPKGEPTGDFSFIPAFLDVPDGVLNVEHNNAENNNHWVQVETSGSIGLTPAARVNRDGIGAVVKVTPEGGFQAMQVVMGGSGYAQQDSLVRNFGLGEAQQATVEVLWTGGVRNRFYNLPANSRITLPEIPCSIDTPDAPSVYRACVEGALRDLVQAGSIPRGFAVKLAQSAVRAYSDEH